MNTMGTPKRMSLNTTLKNAKIFEDDSEDSSESYLTFEELIRQKQAREEEAKVNIKQEKLDVDYEKKPIPDPYNSEFNSSDNCDIAMGRLGLQTPIKNESVDEGLSKSNLKSAKRTLLKQRNSPYSKSTTSTIEEKEMRKNRDLSRNTFCDFDDWDEVVDSKMRKRDDEKKGEKKFETDPVVLERRQKQIDFGKNTIGYDNYVKQIPKEKRTSEDPVTPNKYRVYSRRGFDGLIRQWRLNLHKYDP